MIRRIIHIDMDAFYASVEQPDQPELRGKTDAGRRPVRLLGAGVQDLETLDALRDRNTIDGAQLRFDE